MKDFPENKPSKEPDLVLDETWFFYFDDMVQWNSSEDHCYPIDMIDGEIQFFDDNPDGGTRQWSKYYSYSEDHELSQKQKILNAFESYVAEKILLREPIDE